MRLFPIAVTVRGPSSSASASTFGAVLEAPLPPGTIGVTPAAPRGNSNTRFLQEVFIDIFGVPPSADQLNTLIQRFNRLKHSRVKLIGSLLSRGVLSALHARAVTAGSGSSNRALIDGYYLLSLDRHVDTVGLSTCLGKFRDGGGEGAVIIHILSLPEYYGKTILQAALPSPRRGPGALPGPRRLCRPPPAVIDSPAWLNIIEGMDTSLPAIAGRLDTFRRRCTELGLTLTPQRLAIYQFLATHDSHPSAEEVYREVKPDLPSLSLGTVYRTLELFEENGLVSRVLTLSPQARYDANQDEHHHFICVRCQRVLDSQDARLQQLPVHEAAPTGFQVLSHRVQVLGLCPACRDGR